MNATARMLLAYEAGKASRTQDLTTMIWSGAFDEAYTEGVLGVFFEAGRADAELPRWAAGWRYGAAPACGQSYNYREDRYEAGVSMMYVEGCDWQSDGTYALFNGAQERVAVEGWLITHKRGADGEPLLWTK